MKSSAGSPASSRVEIEHDRKIETHARENLELLGKRRQPEVRLLGMEKLARMRLKHERAGRRADRARAVGGCGNQRLMAPMHAVEVTDGEHAAARFRRHFLVAVNNQHRDCFFR